MKRIFNKQELLDMDLPYAAIQDNIIDNTIWSIYHEIVFEYDGQYYKTNYSVGATEYQDESPWEYDDEIECIEVEEKEVLVKQWVEVVRKNIRRN